MTQPPKKLAGGLFIETDTLIVGAGIAGLSCAARLWEEGHQNFKIVFETFGGRIQHSTSGTAYGAYWVRKDYKALWPYVTLKKRLFLNNYCVWNGKKFQALKSVFIKNPFQLSFLYVHVALYAVAYFIEKRRWRRMGQYDSLSKNLLYQTSAENYLKRFGLLGIKESFINPLIRAATLSSVDELHAAGMLFVLLQLLIPSYEFEMNWEKLAGSFRSLMLQDRITSIEFVKGAWRATSQLGGTLIAKKIVLAIPYGEVRKLVSLSKEKTGPVYCYYWHFSGTPREALEDKKFFVLNSDSSDVGYILQEDGTFLFYSRSNSTDLSRYFSSFKIIHSGAWEPAFYLGNEVLPSSHGQGLFLTGDYNTPNMEDTFLNGKFVAEIILGKTEEKGTSPLSLQETSFQRFEKIPS